MPAKKQNVEITEIPGHSRSSEEVKEVVEEPKAATKDLTSAATGIWPGNTPHRVGSYYCNLHKLNLKAGEAGLLCAMPEGFVFERVDVHGLEQASEDIQIELELQDNGSMGIFHMDKETEVIRQIAESNVYPGQYASKKQVYLKSDHDIPDKGRLLISFIGYQIEPWR